MTTTHVLLVRLKDRSAESVAACRAQLEQQNASLASVVSSEVGTNVRDAAIAYDIANIVRVDDLETYLKEHGATPQAGYVRSVMADAAVVDFES